MLAKVIYNETEPFGIELTAENEDEITVLENIRKGELAQVSSPGDAARSPNLLLAINNTVPEETGSPYIG